MAVQSTLVDVYLVVCLVILCLVSLVGGLIDGSSIHNFNGERLTWNPPEFPQGMIIRYEVLVNETDVFMTIGTEIDINSLGLEPGVYTIQVRM